MNVGSIFDLVNIVANKEQSKAISPEEFNRFIEVVNIEVLKTKMGLPEEYQPKAPYSRQAFQMTQVITENVKHLITRATLTKNSNSRFTFPPDYFYGSSIYYVYKTNISAQLEPIVEYPPITTVPDSEFTDRRSAAILKPNALNPISNYIDGELEVLPELVDNIKLTYVKIPVTPVFAYTVDPATDDIVYDPGNSTQPEWPDDVQIDIAYRILQLYGVNTRDYNLYQIARERQMTGQ